MNQYKIPQLRSGPSHNLRLPGSKSIALRQMAISAMVAGPSTLQGIPICDDIEAMIDCLTALGVQIDAVRDGYDFNLSIVGPLELSGNVTLNARMSGASTRLLLGLASLRNGTTVIDGHPSLRVRTNQPLLDVLQSHQCQVRSDTGGLPATIKGPLVVSDAMQIDGSISSQYITALMLIAPTLLERSQRNTQLLSVTGDLVSKPYLDITINEMGKRGARARWVARDHVEVGHQAYTPSEIQIEGDATAASYFFALATLHGREISLLNLGHDSKQGDFAFAEVMAQLGAELTRTADTTTIVGGPELLALPEIDMTPMPDAALTLIAMAPLIPGDTKITGLSTLHHKECDRLEWSAQALRAMQIPVVTTPDSIMVGNVPSEGISHHLLNTHHDHRMAMAFSTLASVTGHITVDDKSVVDKTYPHYWQHYEALSANS